LYPIEGDFKKDIAYSDNWFGDDKTKFIVDGIDLSKENLLMDDILESENAFIERIKNITKELEI